MQFKATQLQKILGCTAAVEAKWLEAINAACAKYAINTKLRLAAFIAQVGHESARLTAVTENLNYSAAGLQATWPSRFDAAKAAACARQPEKIANVVYSGRMGNGPEASGEGWKYRGRGLIQCTGKSNYMAFSQSAGVDAIGNPDALAQPTLAAMSAGWFWNSKSLNSYADRSDLLSITKRINGGTNGQADREMLYKKALAVLSDEPTPTDEEAAKKDDPTPDTTAPVSEEKTPAAQNASIVEPKAASGDTAKYPWNAVFESRSGHYTEVDDTPGSERLNMTHRTGSYWEIGPDGTYTRKSVLDSYDLTKGDSYDYTGGNYTQQTQGQAFRQSSGDMIFKTGGSFFVNANKVQMNTGMLAVSGEINSPLINASMFGGMSGSVSYGNLVAKEAVIAYDLANGSAPMLGGALGFTSGSVEGDGGSADSHLSNSLSKQSPSGQPWVTNGVPASSGSSGSAGEGGYDGTNPPGDSGFAGGSGSTESATLSSTNSNDYDVPPTTGGGWKVSDLAKVGVGAAAAAAAVTALIKSGDSDPTVANAMASAVGDLNGKTFTQQTQTPVFLKHVSFDKPTLFSQSTEYDKPDPSLYMNNYHTIVDPISGIGRLYVSNGDEWVLVGDPQEAKDYADQITGDLNDQFTLALADEVIARANAITAESIARGQAIAAESAARQAALTQGLLDEATARGAAITAEATARQTEDTSLSNRIVTLTASVDANAAAILQETTARADAISAEAAARAILAAQVDTNLTNTTASITSEQTARANADTALTNSINSLTSTVNTNNTNVTAAINSEASTRASADGALSTRIDAVVASSDANSAAIIAEATARADADSANATTINSVSAIANAKNRTYLQSTAPTAQATGDLWLDSSNGNLAKRWNGTAWVAADDTRIAANGAAITTEQTARADADGALSTRIDAVVATAAANTAAIATEQTARADADSANAQLITVVQSRITNGNGSTFESYKTWDFDALDGWTVSNSTTSLSGGILTQTHTASDGQLISPAVSFAGGTYDKIRARIKRKAGSGWDGTVYYTTAGHGISSSYRKLISSPTSTELADWYIVEWDMSTLTAGGTDWTSSTILSFRIDLGSTSTDAFYIDWVSVGRRGNGIQTTQLAQVQTDISTTANDLGDVRAQWGVKTNVNGHVSGIALVSDLIAGNPTSTFTIEADKFKVVKPGTTDGNIAPFSIDTSGPTPVINMDAAVRIGMGNNLDGVTGNLISNSTCSSTSSYSVGYNNTGQTTTGVVLQAAGSWTPTGMNAVYVMVNNSPANGTVFDLQNDNYGNKYPVVAGKRYEASCYVSLHRTNGIMTIAWYDSSNNYISESQGTTQTGQGATGALSGFPRCTVIATAPANAVKALVWVRGVCNGQASPYVFASMWYFGEAGTNQVNPATWSPGGIGSAPSLSALSANIGLLRTASSGQRTEIDNNGVRVYDGNGTLRVRLGVW